MTQNQWDVYSVPSGRHQTGPQRRSQTPGGRSGVWLTWIKLLTEAERSRARVGGKTHQPPTEPNANTGNLTCWLRLKKSQSQQAGPRLEKNGKRQGQGLRTRPQSTRGQLARRERGQ